MHKITYFSKEQMAAILHLSFAKIVRNQGHITPTIIYKHIWIEKPNGPNVDTCKTRLIKIINGAYQRGFVVVDFSDFSNKIMFRHT